MSELDPAARIVGSVELARSPASLAGRESARRESASDAEGAALPGQIASLDRTDLSALGQVTAGSNIVSFGDGVSAEARADAVNHFLFAQMAAQAANGSESSIGGWYETYRLTLAQLGWLFRSRLDRVHETASANASVHKEIIPLILAIAGPGAAAATIIVQVLERLQDMDKDSPWITLFQRESVHETINLFQVSAVSSEGGTVISDLLGFEIDLEASTTQVLFFKFPSKGAKIKYFKATMELDPVRADRIRDTIERRLADTDDLLAAIPLVRQ
jgi:hypothetical protein